MPILAIRDQSDVARLIEQVRTPFERDLLDTLVSWRFRYESVFKLIEHAAKLGLEDSATVPDDYLYVQQLRGILVRKP